MQWAKIKFCYLVKATREFMSAMKFIVKKLVIVIPVFILALFYFKAHYHDEYAMAGMRGKASLTLGVCFMFLVMAIGVYSQKQEGFLQGFVQSTFLVYVFMVLTLTGYFLLFKEVASHGWWHKVTHRIENKEHVNMRAFLMFKQFRIASKQVIGNSVMLLPLGIFIPLLFRRFSGFIPVFFICLLASICIELMQLITSYRSTDIDDVILNTAGAVTGYIIYLLLRPMLNSR
jgi:glycopeptide antibiotics resistance protein